MIGYPIEMITVPITNLLDGIDNNHHDANHILLPNRVIVGLEY